VDEFVQQFGISAFGMAEVWALMPYLLLALAIPYVVLRVYDSPREDHDPEIELKTVLYYFFSLSVLLLLIGLTGLAVDLIQDAEKSSFVQLFRNPSNLSRVQRAALALLSIGFLGSLFHLVMLFALTNSRTFPEARRVFVGWRLLFHSLVVLVVFGVVVTNAAQEEADEKQLRVWLGILLVWIPSWFLHFVLLKLYRVPAPRFRPPEIREEEEEETAAPAPQG
jgi:hypothetical protein